MFAQLKAYMYGAAALVVVALAAALWFQTARVDRLVAEIALERENTRVCLAANKTSDDAIQELISERSRDFKSCARQLADKDRLIVNLNKIDATTGGHNVSNNGSADNAIGSDNTILAFLNGMYPGAGGRADGVCKAGDPGISEGAGLVSGDVLYCLREVDAKNLLKDKALGDAWCAQGVQIIEGLRQP